MNLWRRGWRRPTRGGLRGWGREVGCEGVRERERLMAHRAHLRGGGVRAWGREVGSEVERDRGVREPRAHRVPSRGRCRGQSCAEAPRARAGPPAVSRPTRLCSGGRSERLSSANYGKGAGSGLRLELVWSRVSGKRTARAGEGGRAPGEEKSDAHQRHEPGDPVSSSQMADNHNDSSTKTD
jgi:hypothetical protein